MKPKDFLKLILLVSFGIKTLSAQNVAITTVVDGTLTSGGCYGVSGTTDPRFIEFYVDGTINFAGYDLGYSANGANYVKKPLDALGTVTDHFIYIIANGDEATFIEAFPAKIFITIVNTTINGNEAFNITDNSGTVIDAFGNPSDVSSATDTSQTWYYGDSYAKRKDFMTPNGGTFVSSNWTYGGANALDGASCATLASTINLGSYSAKSTNWNGNQDSNWENRNNWDNGIPTVGYTAIIQEAAIAPVIAATTAAVANDLIITSTAGIHIVAGGSLIVSGTSSGNITYHIAIEDTHWHLISSPIIGASYDDAWVTNNAIATGTIAISNRGIATYQNNSPDKKTGPWVYMQGGGNGLFASGTGYALKRVESGNYSFTGTYPTGDVSAAITQGVNHWNLIGNPYPSYLEVAAFIVANSLYLSDAFQSIYVWNAANSTYEIVTNGYLHPGQAFFVNSNIPNGEASITKAMQSYQTDLPFYKAVNSASIVLTLSDGTSTKRTQINYLAGKTIGLDPGFDIGVFSGVDSDLSLYTHLISDNQDIALGKQTLPANDYKNLIVPIGIKAAKDKEITITAYIQGLPIEMELYIEDKQTNTFVRLDQKNSPFKINTKNGLDGTGRFYLHTTSISLATKDPVIDNVRVFKTKNATLKLTGLENQTAAVSLFNILGKPLIIKNFKAHELKEMSLVRLNTGIYIIKINLENGQLTRRILME